MLANNQTPAEPDGVDGILLRNALAAASNDEIGQPLCEPEGGPSILEESQPLHKAKRREFMHKRFAVGVHASKGNGAEGGDVDAASKNRFPERIGRRIPDVGVMAFLSSKDKQLDWLFKGKAVAGFHAPDGFVKKSRNLIGESPGPGLGMSPGYSRPGFPIANRAGTSLRESRSGAPVPDSMASE